MVEETLKAGDTRFIPPHGLADEVWTSPCQYVGGPYFSCAFKRVEGLPPGDYRSKGPVGVM